MNFEIRESGVAEEFDNLKTPSENVQLISFRKASAIARYYQSAIVIGADTIVVYNGKIFGKPENEQDAFSALQTLSGQTHQVYTGFTLFDRPSNQSVSSVEITNVTFRKLTKEEIWEYVRSGAPMDKAGAYGIQDDYGAVFVERIEGCFYNVVGFPLTKFYLLMKQFQEQLEL